jgi:hypothetical protein
MKRLLLTASLAIGLLTITGCESTDRMVKNLSSEYGGGLDRTAYVYDNSGKLIRTYKGSFDIKENDYGNAVIFDLNGKRIALYNVQVIVEEN